MKLVNQVLNLVEGKYKLYVDQIADYLSNGIEHSESEEESKSHLMDIGLTSNEASKLISAFWAMGAKERNDLGMSSQKMEQWIIKTLG